MQARTYSEELKYLQLSASYATPISDVNGSCEIRVRCFTVNACELMSVAYSFKYPGFGALTVICRVNPFAYRNSPALYTLFLDDSECT